MWLQKQTRHRLFDDNWIFRSDRIAWPSRTHASPHVWGDMVRVSTLRWPRPKEERRKRKRKREKKQRARARGPRARSCGPRESCYTGISMLHRGTLAPETLNPLLSASCFIMTVAPRNIGCFGKEMLDLWHVQTGNTKLLMRSKLQFSI